MAIYYSSTKNAFYDSTIISGSSIPADKVEITAEEYSALLNAQNNGYLIVSGDGGKPTTIKQDCSACTKTVHELVEASEDTLGHIKLDDTPTTGSKNGVSSDGIKKTLTTMDADLVHIGNAETITGAKIFTADTIVKNENPSCILKTSGATKGTAPSSTIAGGIDCFDNEGTADANKIGALNIEYGTDGNIATDIKAYKPTKGSTDVAKVSVVYPVNGEPYATAPTPPDSDDSNKIATTEWVKKAAPVTSVNGQTGEVTVDVGVTSVNGETGAVTISESVTSVNGKKGDVVIDAGVTSVNGNTGAVTLTIPPTPKTYVTTISHNGNNGYRYWSDGTIENWGILAVNAGNTRIFNFAKAFTSTPFPQICVNTSDDLDAHRVFFTSVTKTSVTFFSSMGGSIYIYAIGK